MKKLCLLLAILPLLSGCSLDQWINQGVTHENVSTYSSDLASLKDAKEEIRSLLYVLPSQSVFDNAEEILNYKYVKRPNVFSNQWLLYVTAKLPDSIYNSEIERLENISSSFPNGATKRVLKYYFGYVTIYENGHVCEYVRKLDDNTLLYVHKYYYDWSKTGIPYKQQLDIQISSDVRDYQDSYNMYVYYDSYSGKTTFTND